MKLDVELHEGVLARDWTSARGRTGERTSARLRLFGPSGMVGVGEATPLPGYSPEELSTAVDELGAVPLQELLPVLDSDDPVAAAFRNPALVALSASARCGLEMALLDMISQQRGILFSELFDTESTDTLETAAVITLGDSSLEQARACLDRGAAALKFKIGHDVTAEVEWIRQVREVVGAEVSIRFDANGAPGLQDADRDRLVTALVEANPEFVEEPGGLAAGEAAGFPVALDESLAAISDAKALEMRIREARARFVVLKPMLLGGVSRAFWMANEARRYGAEPVISHLVDGPIAFSSYVHLACALGAKTSAGLGPHPGLEALGAERLSGFTLIRPTAPGLSAPVKS